MTYIILQETSFMALMEKVNRNLAKGYELQGGVSVMFKPESINSYSSHHYYQAMTRDF